MDNDIEELRSITREIQKHSEETRNIATKINGSVETITALFEMHIGNKCIHHNEPCEDLKKMNWKIIGAMGTATTTLVGMVWKCLT